MCGREKETLEGERFQFCAELAKKLNRSVNVIRCGSQTFGGELVKCWVMTTDHIRS